jgi:surface polysaccharide O-acyltransferase-like enzyme
MVSFTNKDLKRAHHIFKNLDTTVSKYGAAYNDYYLIFYAITGYHLATNHKEKQLFKEEYQKHVASAKFILFDELYLETYFG